MKKNSRGREEDSLIEVSSLLNLSKKKRKKENLKRSLLTSRLLSKEMPK